MTKDGALIEGLFQGETINTPSMLCLEDYLDTLGWAERIGGLDALHARVAANAATLFAWVERTPWIDFLAADPGTRSTTSVCLRIVDPAVARLPVEGQAAFARDLASLLEARASPSTSAPTAMRLRVCGSGAGPRSKRRISRSLRNGSIGPAPRCSGNVLTQRNARFEKG